ncbi:hypothetical protein K4F52_000136 [Lecanicillium sp. MT-2017a]|nr:hypothetical protein K4F52_000136 [Lecanicillium sp. MT-2017a]
MSVKPIDIYNHARGPNPKKLVMILEELGVPYNLIDITGPKDPSFLKINPNGRLPAIVDSNTNLTIWESGAIAEYFVETYDKENKISVPDSDTVNKWHLKELLHFQMSGQGPYYGQGVWFHKFHSEQLPSAKKRYIEQITRVWGVLDGLLKDKQYLLGDKMTYVDLCFVPWEFTVNNFLADELKEFDAEKNYPNYWAWYQRLVARPSTKKAYGL